VNLNLLRIRKEFGMKVALIRVASSESIALSDNEKAKNGKRQKEVSMLWTILIILFILWALGLFAFHAGGLIHVLLVIAVIVLIVRLLQGRKIL
jgi:fatty acid desaturase